MKSKQSKQLTIRQQIQQCPTLTAEERSLALHGLNKARALEVYKDFVWVKSRKLYPNNLYFAFPWTDVSVIKGQSPTEAHDFWNTINKKIVQWKQQN